MFVICDGMPRSASTWSYNVATGLLQLGETGTKVHGAFSDDIALFLGQAPIATGHLVLKCHALDAVSRSLVHAGAAKVVYTHRGPAEAVESAMWMFGLEFDAAVGVIESSLELLRFHSESGTALLIDYEHITGHAEQAVREVASYLGVDPEPAIIDEVVKRTSLARVREKLERIGEPDARARLASHGGSVYDPETLLHPGHLRTKAACARPASFTPAEASELQRLSEKYELGGWARASASAPGGA